MKKKIILSFVLTSLFSTLNADSLEDIKGFYGKINETKNKAQTIQKNEIDDINSKIPKDIGQFNQNGKIVTSDSGNWSMLNENCELDPNMAFQDSLDKFMQRMQEVMSNLMGNVQMWAMQQSYDYACEQMASQYCELQNGYMDYLDMKSVNSKITECQNNKNKNNTDTKSGSQTGTITLGCNIPPGTGVAPPVPMYPFCANPTTVYIQCIYPYQPDCTPYTIPKSTAENSSVIDSASLGAAIECNKNVYDMEKAPAYEKCKNVMKKNCMDYMKHSSGEGLDFANFDLENQRQQCKLDNEYINAAMAQTIKDKSEGKLLPGNKVIKDGKVVKNNENEPDIYYQLNSDDIKNIASKMTSRVNKNNIDKKIALKNTSNTYNKKLLMDQIKLEQEEIKKFLDEVSSKTTFTDLENFMLEKTNFIVTNFNKNPKLYIQIGDLIEIFIIERKNLMLYKHSKYNQYESLFFLEYQDNLKDSYSMEDPNDVARYKNELKNFKSDVAVFDNLLDQFHTLKNIYIHKDKGGFSSTGITTTN